ncbi:unnamed protein product [Arctogadus glacialis]
MSLTDKHKVKRQRLDRICEESVRAVPASLLSGPSVVQHGPRTADRGRAPGPGGRGGGTRWAQTRRHDGIDGNKTLWFSPKKTEKRREKMRKLLVESGVVLWDIRFGTSTAPPADPHHPLVPLCPTDPDRPRLLAAGGQGEQDGRGARSKFEHTELKAAIDSSSVLALPVTALIYQDPVKVEWGGSSACQAAALFSKPS